MFTKQQPLYIILKILQKQNINDFLRFLRYYQAFLGRYFRQVQDYIRQAQLDAIGHIFNVFYFTDIRVHARLQKFSIDQLLGRFSGLFFLGTYFPLLQSKGSITN